MQARREPLPSAVRCVRAAGRDIRRGTSLATMAQFSSDFFRLLSQFVMV
jgi:hypothetical protein